MRVLLAAADDARADHQADAGLHRIQEDRQILRAVRVIRVHHRDDIARRGGEAGAQRPPLAAAAFIADDARTVCARDLRGAIGRVIVHADHLDRPPPQTADRLVQVGQHEGQRLLFVPGRDHDTQLHVPLLTLRCRRRKPAVPARPRQG